MINLKDKVTVVTGGAGALGSAMAHGLARQGAKVVILSRNAENLAQTATAIKRDGGTALGLVADVLNEEQLQIVKKTILEKWKRIDILINAAGGNMPGATIAEEQNFFDLSIEDFTKVNDLNLKGTLLPCLVFGKVMMEQGVGSIINISSMAAQQAITRIIGYSASKAAVENLTRWLAVEMAKKFGDGIRVNAIAPGFFIGNQNRGLLINENSEYTPRAQAILKNTPMGRFGEPEELVGATLWLSSEMSSFVTGIVIPVDGGFSAFSGV